MRLYGTGILAMAALLSAACSSSDKSSPMRNSDLGTGINTVDRNYAKPAAAVYDAALAAVKGFDLVVESDRHDRMGGDLVARRAGGERVNITIRSVDEKNATSAVRVEPGNRNLAEMIQEKIASKLGFGEATTGLFGGGASVDGTYAANITACVAAAEAACRKLNMTVTQRDVQDASAQVDARNPENSTPARIKMTRSDHVTKISFIAGASNTDDTKSLAQRLKMEFDKTVSPQGN